MLEAPMPPPLKPVLSCLILRYNIFKINKTMEKKWAAVYFVEYSAYSVTFKDVFVADYSPTFILIKMMTF